MSSLSKMRALLNDVLLDKGLIMYCQKSAIKTLKINHFEQNLLTNKDLSI